MENITSIKEEDELVIFDNIEIIQEDEGNESLETTLSATELLCDLGDFEGYIIDDQATALDLTNIVYDDIFKEIENTSNEFLSCKLCQQDFSNMSNLYRHLRSKKHQAMEAALYVETFNIGVPDLLDANNGQQMIQDSPFNIDNNQYKIITKNIKCEGFDSTAGYEFSLEPTKAQTQKFNFKCMFCMKSFSTSSNLRRHTNLHLPDDIYKCAFCPRKFKQREYWKKHSESCRNKQAKAMIGHYAYLP